MLVELDQDNLEQIISENNNTVVQFSAVWCGNCRLMKPKFKRMATENENVAFVIDKGFIASLNVAVITLFKGTPVASSIGSVAKTIGRIVMPVVKLQT